MEGVGGFEQERPEHLNAMRCSGVELQVGDDAVTTGSVGQLVGVLQHIVIFSAGLPK